MSEQTKTSENAEAQARGAGRWIDQVAEVLEWDEEAEGCPLDPNGFDCLSEEEVQEIQEDVHQYLSQHHYGISFEAKWSAGDQPHTAYITTGGGGPASRLAVDLDCQVGYATAWAEGQDWFTPWVRVYECSGDAARLLHGFCEGYTDV